MTYSHPRGFATLAIHSGQEPDPATGAVNVPIYASSTFVQEGLGKNKGYEYSRVSNPTRTALETCLATLEGGHSGHAFASGMAALQAVLMTLRSGDHVVCGSHVYGGTLRLLNRVMSGFGIETTCADTRFPDQVAAAFRPTTRLLMVESPTNPCLELCDLRQMADLAHAHGADLLVDNTFLSPYFQRPIELGADLVMHSTTKFLNGHSDGVGGAILTTRAEQAEAIHFIQKASGAILSPFECYLILRGVKTLPVRMRQHDANGRIIAEWLAGHPGIPAVYYPGLPDHPQHELARRQASGFGSMLSFETGSLEAAGRVLERVRLCSVGESLGGVETLISHPASMSHGSLAPELRRAAGVSDGLLRLSVGIEDVEDIQADLAQAMAG